MSDKVQFSFGSNKLIRVCLVHSFLVVLHWFEQKHRHFKGQFLGVHILGRRDWDVVWSNYSHVDLSDCIDDFPYCIIMVSRAIKSHGWVKQNAVSNHLLNELKDLISDDVWGKEVSEFFGEKTKDYLSLIQEYPQLQQFLQASHTWHKSLRLGIDVHSQLPHYTSQLAIRLRTELICNLLNLRSHQHEYLSKTMLLPRIRMAQIIFEEIE